jgi:hypothetical protein
MKYLFLLLIFTQVSFAADLPKLQTLLKKKITTFYAPRFCGQNIDKMVRAADKKRIDLTNSYVAVLKHPGFWGLQAFSARGQVGQRQPWGFHVILIADNHVFDLDFTNQPKVLPLKKYFTEMFVPKTKPDIPYDFKSELPYIELELYSSHDYLKNNGITKTTPKRTYKLGDLIDLRDI